MEAFCPNGATVELTISGASVRGELTDLDPVCGAVRVRNGNVFVVNVKFGDDTVTATASDMSLGGQTTEIFRVPPGATHLAVFSSSSGTAFEFTIGQI